MVFSCKKKIVPKNPFSKTIYIFEDFYFIEDDETIEFDTEFCMIAFRDKFESCQFEI